MAPSKTFLKLLFSILIMITINNGFPQTPKKAEKVFVNGINIYYEVYGNGEPLFLLHGYTQSSKLWQPFVEDYINDFEVYLIDLRGHGKSDLYTEKLSIKNVAQDLNELIKYLKLEKIKAVGFSFGGDVLFQLVLINPELVESMIIIGSCGSWNAKDFPDWIEYLSYKNIENLPWMREMQTSEQQSKSILDQLINYDITITVDELKKIKTKTLLMYGDKEDSITWECILSAKNNLQNSYLWVLPNTPHRAHLGENKSDFVKTSKKIFSNSWQK